jgi:hypothetical protein
MLSPEFRLQYVYPYLHSAMKDSNTKVVLAAMNASVNVLRNMKDVKIGHTDQRVFEHYIFISIKNLVEHKE